MSPLDRPGRGEAGRLAAAALLLAALVAGCGFQLRSWDLTSAFETARIVADSSVTVDAELRRALDQAGVALIDGTEAAGAVIRLSDQREARRGVSTTRGARTAEYEVALSLTFSAQNREGNEMVGERRISAERTFRIDQEQPGGHARGAVADRAGTSRRTGATDHT